MTPWLEALRSVFTRRLTASQRKEIAADINLKSAMTIASRAKEALDEAIERKRQEREETIDALLRKLNGNGAQ